MKMRLMRCAALVLSLLLPIAGTAFGQAVELEPPAPGDEELPCIYPRMDQVDAHLRVKVTRSTGGFDFQYLLENRPSASQILESFAIQAFPAGNAIPTQVNPPGWDGLGEMANTRFYTWYTLAGPRGLIPGTWAQGFGFAKADLPAIVTFLSWGKVEPPSFPEGMAPESCEGTDAIENSFKGKTVGPKAPPQPFVPLEFLNYLIALLHDSRQQGWIRVDGIHQSLLAKLLAAKRSLEAGRSEPAKGQLKAFLNEVQAVSCAEFTCPGNKPLTSEAHALLFFNGQYLFERLPASGATTP